VDAERLVWALLAAYDGLAAYDMFLPGLDLAEISDVFVETLLSGLMVEQQQGSACSGSGSGSASRPG
jgi:hypothetical protein